MIDYFQQSLGYFAGCAKTLAAISSNTREIESLLNCYPAQWPPTLYFTGVGKSGFVARKVASTFASLGFTAYYLDPLLAAHGDLGVCRRKDWLFVFSKSGGSLELQPVVEFGFARVIGFSLGRGPAWFQGSLDTSLTFPDLAEDAFIKLPPMASCHAMMMMGDALAVTLAERFGTGHDPMAFGKHHPSGVLGQDCVQGVGYERVTKGGIGYKGGNVS